MTKFYIYTKEDDPELYFVESDPSLPTTDPTLDMDGHKYAHTATYNMDDSADWVGVCVAHSHAIGTPMSREYVLDATAGVTSYGMEF